MSITQAVQVMIEGNGGLTLPQCYETVGGPFFDRLEVCKKILQRRYKSAVGYGSEKDQNAILLHVEEFDKVIDTANHYKFQLEKKIGTDVGKPVTKKFLIDWALSAFNIDIFGINAEQNPTDSPDNSTAQSGALDPLPANQSTENSKTTPSKQFTDGENLFLVMSFLFDDLMTATHGDWRHIINDKTDETSNGYLLSGRLNQAAVARDINNKLPSPLSDREPSKAYHNHASMLDNYLRLKNGPPIDFHYQAKPMVKLSIYSLATLLWIKKSDGTNPDPEACEYAKGAIDGLAAMLPDSYPITRSNFIKILEESPKEVLRQKGMAIAKAEESK